MDSPWLLGWERPRAMHPKMLSCPAAWIAALVPQPFSDEEDGASWTVSDRSKLHTSLCYSETGEAMSP